MKHIGREPSPAERALQILLERPEVLDRAGFNVFVQDLDLVTCDASKARWDSLGEALKDRWKQRAIERQRAHMRKCDDNR